MRRGQHSETAEAMAAIRAGMCRYPVADRLVEDPFAERFVVGRYRFLAAISRFAPARCLLRWGIEVLNPGAISYIGLRHRTFDDALRKSLGSGVRRVVLLGAGFDSRALRFSSHGATFVEIDHPDTQAVKRAVLEKNGWFGTPRERIELRAADLEAVPLRRVLDEIQAGVDPVLIIWEGVAWYLTEASVRQTLADLAAWAPPGSELVFDTIDAAVVDGRRNDRAARAHRDYCRRRGEPIQWGLDRERAAPFLQEQGWALAQLTPATAAAERYFTKETRLGQPLPFMFFVFATRGAPLRGAQHRDL
ncbi:MAG: SAM-dependent methyltransferase [Candidatus Schekmanbacteria bacterium]|nr:SAM-dependent methyltransferase [Candidatus Schekmanbacteria bacterium]